MEEGAGRTKTVCVTGAGGFVASWLVKLLLSRGCYTVHGTVRDPGDAKNAHLMSLDGAVERLRLFKADLLDYGSVAAAIAGCDDVFHVDILAPAVTGTTNVLKACSEAKVGRVVVVSSVSAAMVNPNWPEGKAIDEDCWSDVDYCRATKNWYTLGKTIAEIEAFDHAKRSGLDLVTLCPSLVIGPLLQPTVNASSDCEVKIKLRNFVDVRDVADALLLLYETPGVSGRYICSSHARRMPHIIDLLKSWFPGYKFADKFVQVSDEPSFNSGKLEKLGWKIKPFEETLRDSVESYRAAEGMAAATARQTVCVTGAGGFIASSHVKLLLSRGNYAVRGTVRDPGDAKNAHLKALQGAEERLQLLKADLLDYDSVASAVAGCVGVFHVASPVPSSRSTNPEVEVIAPAVTGTLNVLKACHEAKVKRVVMVSSIAALFNNPNWPKDKALTEDSWSDEELCRKNQDWYYLSKTVAEREAFAYAAKTGLDIVTICPSLVIGPLMQSTVNSSSKILINYFKGDRDTVENRLRNVVDVRDVANALLLAYENPGASGRYICSSAPIRVSDMINILKTLYPTYTYPKNFADVEENTIYSSEKLQKLGWTFRPIEETLRDSEKTTMDDAAAAAAAAGRETTTTKKKKTVCVTGAGGFVASWLVHRLLSSGDYVVHGTVRDPSDAKNDHLVEMDGAGERRLRLFKADVLDRASVAAAVAGCVGVFHVASPVPAAKPHNPDAEVLAPAVAGTRNVLQASHKAGVRRVVVVSSAGAVILNPAFPLDAVLDEDAWSDEHYCRSIENWYCLSKTLAEREAWRYAADNAAAMDVVTVCPPLILGPLLQSTVNTSSSILINLIKGDGDEENAAATDKRRNVVDVRDVAAALVLTYENPQDSGGRYICSAYDIKVSEMVDIVRRFFPDINYPKFVGGEDERILSSKKLRKLGWKFRTVEECLRDSVQSYKACIHGPVLRHPPQRPTAASCVPIEALLGLLPMRPCKTQAPARPRWGPEATVSR
uniref:NAD-dependent epimerase/dehydratase domain-containing protein n=1 Tax=Oryza punctata TaxID=4537 RepID=A0A0E0LDM5_ORYPU